MPVGVGTTVHDDIKHTGSSKRGGSAGVAALDAEKVLIASQLPPCYEGFSHLSCDSNNEFAHYATGTPTYADSGSAPYSMNLKTNIGGTGQARSRTRGIWQFDVFFLEFGCHITRIQNGTGGIKETAIGFIQNGSVPLAGNYAVFRQESDNTWHCKTSDGVGASDSDVVTLLGRELAADDMVTVRVGYDVRGGTRYAAYYVNGELIVTHTLYVPDSGCYAGLWVYAGDALITVSHEIEYESYHFKRIF